jgi:hypothetical protein
VLAALGSIDYWFVTEGRRVHKTVHHYLLRFSGGELCDEDVEVTEVAWVPVEELPDRLAYADERRLAEVAGELINLLQSDGPAALPPLPRTSPRRRPQTHSHTRNRRSDEAGPRQSGPRTNGCGPGRDDAEAGHRRTRILLVLGLLALLTMPTTTAPAAAGEPGSVPFLQVRLDRVTPDLVTTTSDPTLTVTATVTNVGDRPVRDVVARLEHAPAVTSSAGLRTNLDGGTDQYQPVGEFVNVSGELQRGQAVEVAFAFPIRSTTALAGHRCTRRLPLLVNVNGTPDYGEPARLDDARFLLPVLGAPPDPADRGDALSGAVAPDTTRPIAVTMLWPLADRPRLAPGVPGGTTPVRLMNDDLAVSLAAGGRLDTLLGAADFATSPAVDPGGDVGRALCLAVDPDLLVTVNAMTAGYVVADAPDGLGTAAHPGTGQAAAVAWLDRLRTLAKRMCVVATPYAQADLGRCSGSATGGSAPPPPRPPPTSSTRSSASARCAGPRYSATGR